MLDCKQVTKLISQERERALSPKEKMALRMHLMMCSGCNKYNKQMDLISEACKRFSGKD